MKLLCAKRKEKKIREFLKTLQKLRENFSTKTKKASSFECLKLLNFSSNQLVMNLSPNTPIYRRGLGFRDKTHLRLNRSY